VAKLAGLPVIKNPCPYITAELMLVSRMHYTMRSLLCPLVLLVNTDDASLMKHASSVNSR
jgi:hypothetical protein